MIVARHEVPGIAPPQMSRPVGYGMIRAGVLHRFEGWREEISYGTALSRDAPQALRAAWLRSACPSRPKPIEGPRIKLALMG
jgi:hypothetical protein